MPIGQYELRFAVGDYFTSQQTIPGLPFLDIVPVRFSVAEPEGHYHIPSVAYHALGLRRLPWSLKVEPEVSAPLPYSNLVLVFIYGGTARREESPWNGRLAYDLG